MKSVARRGMGYLPFKIQYGEIYIHQFLFQCSGYISFKIQYGEIYIFKRHLSLLNFPNLKSNMERFIWSGTPGFTPCLFI